MWLICLIFGIIYIFKLFYIILNKTKKINVFELYICGIFILFLTCIFSYSLLISVINDYVYIIIIVFEIFGLKYLKYIDNCR